mgnify:CR=1 FL=1
MVGTGNFLNVEIPKETQKIILALDNDDAGNQASIECAQLFTPKKALVSKLPMKDANEMLVSNRGKDMISHIWNARPYTPEGIIAGSDTWDLVIQDDNNCLFRKLNCEKTLTVCNPQKMRHVTYFIIQFFIL